MMVRVIFSICLIAVVRISAMAQGDLAKQYFNAKNLYREGKYNLAMESFKPLIPIDPANPFSQYATFYTAVSAYKLGYKALAKTTFGQIQTLYPQWEKIDEVRYWIGKINLENKDYFQGLKMLSTIENNSFQKSVSYLKKQSIPQIEDIETLRMMREEYPNDRVVAEALAAMVSKELSTEEDRSYLESLIREFNLNSSDYIPVAPKTYFKDAYSVSVLLPFMVRTLDPSPAPKRNQSVLDLYEGMKLAVDTLAKLGTKINLNIYDTERSVTKIERVLNTEELKNTDLIIGPFFQEENTPIADFSLKNKVNTFNPLHNNSDLIGINPYAFLYQPSLEVLGRKSGEFLADYVSKKECMVFYGASRRDSVLAANFMQSASENGLIIVAANRLSRDDSQSVLTILAKPTEYDELRYPKEFTLKKDSLGSIFVASDDALIYAKVISSIETRGDKIIVLGSESWLDQHTIALEKFQNLPIVLSAPNFSNLDKPATKAFVKKYVRTHGRVPSNYARIGYEQMLFLGSQFKKNGVYFQDGLSHDGVIPGYLTEGFDYRFGRSNARVPFVKFEDGSMKVIEDR